MEGNVNASDLATLSLIGNSGGYGGGYGVGASRGGGYGSLYAGNSVLAADAHANGTATKEAIDGNADLIRAQANSFENAERARQVSGIEMGITASTSTLAAQISNIELNALRDKADVLVAINTNAKDAAACCCDAKLKAQEVACETQKLVISENQTTRDLINDRELARVTDANNINATVGAINANANSNTAAIVAAIQGIDNNHHR